MEITPRYDGAAIIQVDGAETDMLSPVVSQHHRFAKTLAELTEAQWRAPSRCDQWSVRDVVSHLAGVNEYWVVSISSGRDGSPTRYLNGFDPVAVPAAMVAATADETTDSVHQRFIDSSDRLLELLSSLSADEWGRAAEAPPGWLPIRLVAAHALWDAWTHERDITVPLGLTTVRVDEEMTSSLAYVCALSGALAILLGRRVDEPLSLRSREPDLAADITLSDSCVVRMSDSGQTGASLSGDAVDLLDSLSFRAPMPDGSPAAWRQLMIGLATFFNTSVS